MIRPVRRAHLVASALLAVALPLGFVLGLAARVEWPREAGTPAATSVPDAPPIRRGLSSRKGFSIEYSVWSRGAQGAPLLRLDAARTAAHPDLLVYWVPGTHAPDGPARGHFLGTLGSAVEGHGASSGEYSLPERARSEDGWLLVYSLAHAQSVCEVELVALEGT